MRTLRDISPNDATLVLEIHLPAGVTEVMAAWTDPERLTTWCPPRRRSTRDPAAATPSDGRTQGWWLRGRVTQLTATRLTFSWRWDHRPELPDRTVRVSVTPGATASSSVLSLEHGPYDGTKLDQADRAHHEAGWQYFLDRLATTLGEPSPAE